MLPVSHAKYAFLAVIAASATLSSSVFAQRPKNPPPDDCPNDNPECKCPTDDAVENGCVLISLDLGRTTPWTGSDSVKLKIRTTKASPSLSTPSQLKLVLGYSFMYVGSDLTAAGAPRFVFFAQSAGRTLSFQFADGSSVGVPSPGMYGESKTRLQMVDAEGWATLSNPAYYDLYPGDGSVYRFSASPAAPDFGNLVHRIDPRGVLSTWEDMGVTVLRDAAGNIRQVSTRTRLADVQTLSDTHYTVTVFPLDAEPETDPDTGLLVPPQWNPTRVLDVSQGSSPLELLVGFQKGTGDMRQYRYVEQNGEWTLVKPSGLVDSKEIFYSANETGARRLHLIRSPEGELLRRTEMNFASTPWGWAMTNRIEGIPGDATRTTSWSFYEEGPNRGEIREKITPTGNRILYEYDDKNRVVRESMPLVEKETLYSYAPVDPSDPPLLCDTRPRCVVRKMQGIEIQRTYYVYGTNGVDVVERVGEQGAAYGGTNVLRTVTTYYPIVGAITDGLVQSVSYENGTLDQYSYYNDEGVWREYSTHFGFMESKLNEYVTTRSVSSFDRQGHLREAGEQLFVGGTNWVYIKKMSYEYDKNGNIIEVTDLDGKKNNYQWGDACCGAISERNWNGSFSILSYDEEGRMVAKQNLIPDSGTTYKTYDELGQTIQYFTSNSTDKICSSVTTIEYDSLGRIHKESLSNGAETVFDYTPNGEIESFVRQNGFSTTIIRLADGMVSEIRQSDSCSEFRIYGVTSKGIQWKRTVMGNTTNAPRFHIEYVDLLGRTVKTERPGANDSVIVEINEYDNRGLLIKSGSSHFGEVHYIYDQYGNQVSRTQFRSNEWVREDFQKDISLKNGVLYEIRSKDISSSGTNIVQREWTKEKRLTGQTLDSFDWHREATSDGIVSVSWFQVDNSGNVVKHMLDNSAHSKSVSLGNQVKYSVDALSNTNTICYDGLGRIVKEEGSTIPTTIHVYGKDDRLEKTIKQGVGGMSFEYDAAGNIVATSNLVGQVIRYTYDVLNRIRTVRGDTYAVDFEYDDFGNLSSCIEHQNMVGSSASRTRYHFDARTGLLLYVQMPDGQKLTSLTTTKVS